MPLSTNSNETEMRSNKMEKKWNGTKISGTDIDKCKYKQKLMNANVNK